MNVKDFVTGIQHIGIPTNDSEETVKFFKSLGFVETYSTDNHGEKVVFLQQKNIVIETYQNGKAVGHPGAIEHMALDVTDIEAAYDAVRKLGYTALEGSIQSLPFWEHGVRYFTIAGPDGEKVEFNQILSA